MTHIDKIEELNELTVRLKRLAEEEATTEVSWKLGVVAGELKSIVRQISRHSRINGSLS